MFQPTIRIARKIRTAQGTIIRTEVFGSWYVRPEEWPNSPKAQVILRDLQECQAEEPDAGWKLETQGTERSWHEVEGR